MDLTALNGLDRTATLISADVLSGKVSAPDVVQGLTSYRAEIHATAAALRSPAAQTATITLAIHLAMCGVGVKLSFPDLAVAGAQPPLVGADLKRDLRSHLRSTWPWVSVDSDERPHVRFLIGETPPIAADDLVVTGGADRLNVGAASDVVGVPWIGAWPIAPVGCGIAAAAVAVRRAARALARQHRLEVPVILSGPDATTIRIDTKPVAHHELGIVPVVSAGAITHAALFALLRVGGLAGRFEVYDDDVFDVSNLNRYALITGADLGSAKATQLDQRSSAGIEIAGRDRRYRPGDGRGARRILVGADDIAVRWAAQDDVSGWLGIGATSHLFAQVSSHGPGTPCAGCVHDHEDAVPEIIPTIGIVSGWAGLMLAAELLRSLGDSAGGTMISGYPLGLGGSHGHAVVPCAPNPRCHRRCARSVRAA